MVQNNLISLITLPFKVYQRWNICVRFSSGATRADLWICICDPVMHIDHLSDMDAVVKLQVGLLTHNYFPGLILTISNGIWAIGL